MWSIWFNQLRSPDFVQIRNILREDMNYESAYTKVISGSYSQDEKDYFTCGLTEAYKDLDRSIRSHMADQAPWLQSLRSFIFHFSGSTNERGFVFTLNQDLLLERFYNDHACRLQIPSLERTDWFCEKLTEAHFLPAELPSAEKVENCKAQFWTKGSDPYNFCYVKLHGSYGWKSLINKDAMVIGYDKAGSIAKEPLLQWYLDLFREVLNSGVQTLVVVGYGFMDEHINRLIVEAPNIRLHVISPLQPQAFKDLLVLPVLDGKRVPFGKRLWQMLDGYYCASVEQMYAGKVSAVRQTFLENVGFR